MTETRCTVIWGDHPKLGRFFAAIDPSVRFTDSHLSSTKLGAILAAFPDAEAARAALAAAGAVVDVDKARGKVRP